MRIGTRGSELALTQTGMVADALADALGPGSREAIELVRIRTAGDRLPGSLASLGGTGVFVTALREALLAGSCDLAVHSMKDLPTAPPEGLRLVAVPERADPRDALCARDDLTLATLPPGARVGTGSPRRAAQLLAARPDLEVVDLRGNVPTRLGRVPGHQRAGHEDPGDLDAVVLAMAGLTRLGLLDAVTEPLDPATVRPAPAQGALAVEAAGPLDPAAEAALATLDHRPTRLAVIAERALLATLEAGCAAPVGALGRLRGDVLVLDAVVCATDGSRRLVETGRVTLPGKVAHAVDPGEAKQAGTERAAADADADADADTDADTDEEAARALGARVAASLLALGAADLVRAAHEVPHPAGSPTPAGPPNPAGSPNPAVAPHPSGSPTPSAAPHPSGGGPLAGWRVLVPRGGEWAKKVADLLAPHGATTVAVPLIEFAPPHDLAPLNAALDRLALGRYDWLAVTSATTVSSLAARVAARRMVPASPDPGEALAAVIGATRVAAVGPATAATLQRSGIDVALVPSTHSAAGLVEAAPAGPGRVLVPHSDLADATLADGLRARGFEVDEVVAYRTVAGPPAAPSVRTELADGRIHAVLLSSPSTVTQLLELVGAPPAGTVVACIGPRTARAAEAAGLTVHVTPPSSSTEDLVDALVRHAQENL